MKKLIAAGLLAGLLAASFAVPVAAKKRRPKPPPGPVPVEQKLFLRQDSASCQTPHTFLSLADEPDVTCLYHEAGAPYEVANLVAPTATAVWAIDDATVPFVFDTAKKITGEITIHGGDTGHGTGPLSAGQARFDVVVLAEIAGEVKEVGTSTDTWTTAPGDVHAVALEMAIDPALAGARVDAFRIETTMRGAAIGPHTIALDDPASFLVIPTLR